MTRVQAADPPLTGPAALDRYFLEARCKIIEIAACLDRIDHGQDASAARGDPRYQKLRQAIDVLLTAEPGRAERCQMVFSLPYDAQWTPPNRA